MMTTVLLSAISVLLGIIAFFLVRFFNKVDSIDKSLIELQRHFAVSDEKQNNIVKDVEEVERSTMELSRLFAEMRLEWIEVKNIILLKPQT